MNKPIFKLTGKEASDEIMNVIARLNNGEDVSAEEIETLPEIQYGRGIIADICKEVGLGDGKDTTSLPNRETIIENSINELLSFGSIQKDENGKTAYTGEVACDKRIDIIIGLPSSGKSSVITDALSMECMSMVIDNDEAKKTISEFRDGWGGDLVHKESGIIEGEVIKQALKEGRNIVIPKVGSFDLAKGSLEYQSLMTKIIEPAKELGYTVNVHYVDLEAHKANARMLSRFINDGRWMPPDLITGYKGKVDIMYNLLKDSPLVDGYSRWDNDVPFGEKPILMESHNLNDEYIKNAKTDDRPLISEYDIDNIKSEVDDLIHSLKGTVASMKTEVEQQIMFVPQEPKSIIDKYSTVMNEQYLSRMGEIAESLSQYKRTDVTDNIIKVINESVEQTSKSIDFVKGQMEYALDKVPDNYKKLSMVVGVGLDAKSALGKIGSNLMKELSKEQLTVMNDASYHIDDNIQTKDMNNEKEDDLLNR